MIEQQFDAIDKVHVFYEHAKVNGVEVSFAGKASGQIGFGFDRGMSAFAKGAAEPQDAFERFRRDGEQGFYYMADGDMVANFV